MLEDVQVETFTVEACRCGSEAHVMVTGVLAAVTKQEAYTLKMLTNSDGMFLLLFWAFGA